MSSFTLLEERAKKHAERMFFALRELLEDTQHKDHDCGEAGCPVDEARKVVRLVEGTPEKSSAPYSPLDPEDVPRQ